MKQTTVEGLWAHISCAWFIPEVYFTDTVNMEPIEGVEKVGLERIGLVSFWETSFLPFHLIPSPLLSSLNLILNCSAFFVFYPLF